ncbi:MAG: sensor histidine kinase, partial [Hydrogenobacter sp.]
FMAGMLMGLSIFTSSYVLINLSNKYLLRRIPEIYWQAVSLLVSFFAGAVGGYVGYKLISVLDLIQMHIERSVLLLGLFILGLLTSVIGYLLYWIVNIRRIKLETEKELIMARLRFLEYQINPHFLFNTLNVLAELAHINPPLAERSILVFSRYLRDIIDQESVIPLDKELSIVKNFIFIYRLRFPDIQVEYQIEEDLLTLLVPKLSVQVLVENALKHGIGNKGRIDIKAYKKDHKAIIEVRDNGKGFDQISEGAGLTNLRRRLEYLVGGRLYYKRENDQTVFWIEIDL